jgi:hypothetical protein
MISRQQIDESLTKLGLLRYFPTKDAVVAEIGRLIGELCFGDQEARQLTAAVCSQCAEWPGPARFREIHQEVVASRRLRESEPEGCGLCVDGYRTVFQIFERPMRGGAKPEVIEPEGSIGDVMRQWNELLARCGSTTHLAYQAVKPCTCELGSRRREARQKLAVQKQGQ